MAAAYVCDGTGSSEEAAYATASAYAAAVASVVANCVLAGDASASVKAAADARARAEVWVSAFFDVVAQATDCEKCEAWASSWGYIEKYVFLEAIAQAGVRVCFPPIIERLACIMLVSLHPKVHFKSIEIVSPQRIHLEMNMFCRCHRVVCLKKRALLLCTKSATTTE
jgi:hypothetical protein